MRLVLCYVVPLITRVVCTANGAYGLRMAQMAKVGYRALTLTRI